MHEIEMLGKWSEITLIEIDAILGDKQESVLEFGFQMFRDESLNRLTLALRDRTHDEILLPLCS